MCKIVMANSSLDFVCNLCDFQFDNKSAFEIHLSLVHDIQTKDYQTTANVKHREVFIPNSTDLDLDFDFAGNNSHSRTYSHSRSCGNNFVSVTEEVNDGTSLSKMSANENFASATSYHQNISKERHLDYNYMEDGQRNSYYYDRKYESKLNSHADDVGNGTSVSKLSANENFSSPAFYHQNISKESFTKNTHSDYELVEDSQRNTYLQSRKCEDNFNSFTNEVGNEVSVDKSTSNEKFSSESEHDQNISKESHTKNKGSKRGYLKYSKADVVPALDAIKKGMSVSQASRHYGIPPRTLYDKMKKMDVKKEDSKSSK